MILAEETVQKEYSLIAGWDNEGFQEEEAPEKMLTFTAKKEISTTTPDMR